MAEAQLQELTQQLTQQKLAADIQRAATERMMNEIQTLRGQMDTYAVDKEKQTQDMKDRFENWAAGKEAETSQLRAEIATLRGQQANQPFVQNQQAQYFDMESQMSTFINKFGD